MNTFSFAFGWMFIAITALFALGLTKPGAKIIYPHSPNLTRRLAAPIIFGVLAIICFLGYAVQAMVVTAVAGSIQIAVSRWQQSKQKLS